MDKKQAHVFIIMSVLLVVVVTGGLLTRFILSSNTGGSGVETVCPQDAKVCPDGSAVRRTGPNCEFAACPEWKVIPSDITMCTEDSECLAVPDRDCCSSLRSINKKYEPLYREHPEWQEPSPERMKQCVLIRCIDNASTLNVSACRQNRCVLVENVIDTSGWKTYRNEEYGFEMKYPNNLLMGNTNGDGVILQDVQRKELISLRIISKREAESLGCSHPTCNILQIDNSVRAIIRSMDIAPTEARIDISAESSLYFRLLCEQDGVGDSAHGVSFCIISLERRKLFEQILSTFSLISQDDER